MDNIIIIVLNGNVCNFLGYLIPWILVKDRHCFDHWLALAKWTLITVLKCVSINLNFTLPIYVLFTTKPEKERPLRNGWIDMKYKMDNKKSLFYVLLTWYITLVTISVTRDHKTFCPH